MNLPGRHVGWHDRGLCGAEISAARRAFLTKSRSISGPYVVVKEITPNAYELTGLAKGTPTMYHRTKLKCYLRYAQGPQRLSPPPSPLKFVDGQVEYEVERVLDHREVRGRRQYLLQ